MHLCVQLPWNDLTYSNAICEFLVHTNNTDICCFVMVVQAVDDMLNQSYKRHDGYEITKLLSRPS